MTISRATPQQHWNTRKLVTRLPSCASPVQCVSSACQSSSVHSVAHWLTVLQTTDWQWQAHVVHALNRHHWTKEMKLEGFVSQTAEFAQLN
mmetsp:Transcript_22583/g.37753  ORF Transcript_22583/g.37753 Transcript_22583/m.37753 type:complete len:91 (-) Transcript_22583:667-939(-)